MVEEQHLGILSIQLSNPAEASLTELRPQAGEVAAVALALQDVRTQKSHRQRVWIGIFHLLPGPDEGGAEPKVQGAEAQLAELGVHTVGGVAEVEREMIRNADRES